jgi:MFS family permease
MLERRDRYHLRMRWLRILYLSSGLSFGALYGFMTVLLQSKGFEPALIGLTTSLGALGYSVALPVWGHLGDIVSGPRRTLQMGCIPAALFAVALAAPLPALGVILCVVAICAGAGPALALTDAMAVPALSDASREYSGLRLIASLGGAGGSVACGLLYSQTGYAVAPLVFVAAMGMTVVAAQFIPLGRDSERRRRAAAGPGRSAPEQPRGRFGSVGEALTGRPRLLASLVSIGFVFAGVNVSAMYVSLRVSDLGGGPPQVGLVNGVAAFAEIPGLLLAGWLAWRLGLRPVLAASALGLAACLASWVVLEDPLTVLVTRFATAAGQTLGHGPGSLPGDWIRALRDHRQSGGRDPVRGRRGVRRLRRRRGLHRDRRPHRSGRASRSRGLAARAGGPGGRDYGRLGRPPPGTIRP